MDAKGPFAKRAWSWKVEDWGTGTDLESSTGPDYPIYMGESESAARAVYAKITHGVLQHDGWGNWCTDESK